MLRSPRMHTIASCRLTSWFMLLELSTTNTNRSPLERAPKKHGFAERSARPPAAGIAGAGHQRAQLARQRVELADFAQGLCAGAKLSRLKLARQVVGDVEFRIVGNHILQLRVVKARRLDFDLTELLSDDFIKIGRAGEQRNVLLSDRGDRDGEADRQRQGVDCEAAQKRRRGFAIASRSVTSLIAECY